MAAVYGIVRKHGGHIAVVSQPGKGTQVNLYLPAAEPAAAATRSQTPEEGHGGTALLIEDEQMVGEMSQTILERLGYKVVSAQNGREAVARLQEAHPPYDFVLLDIKLPDMDGSALYPIVRKHRPAAKVIICSGYALDGRAQVLIDAGADGYIQKPFSIQKMAEKINEVMAPHQAISSKNRVTPGDNACR